MRRELEENCPSKRELTQLSHLQKEEYFFCMFSSLHAIFILIRVLLSNFYLYYCVQLDNNVRVSELISHNGFG